jgi:hypothetical protein
LGPVFHVELKQFPHVARAFNLTLEQLHARIVARWVSQQTIELDDRRWSPERARLTIYEAPELRTDELGLGRGWANVTRVGEDVTERVLAQSRGEIGDRPAVEQLKLQILSVCEAGPLGLDRIARLASGMLEGHRASERLALAEQAVWELLHQGKVRLVGADGEVLAADWQTSLLGWATWVTPEQLTLEPLGQ